ncbi:MAG: LysR family transcriptional regulator [Thermodesulfobacteriota bacterium]
MELRHLIYVTRLAQYLHFSRTAEDLCITQPSLSQQIMQVEEELGVKLFKRRSRSVELTPAGEEFVAHAATVLKDVERLQEAMRRCSATKKGRVRVGTLMNMALLNLNHHLQAFQDQHTNISLDILEMIGSDELLKLLGVGSIDLALTIPPPDLKLPRRFLSCPLIRGRVVAVLPVDHPLAARPSLRLVDLAEEKLVFPIRAHTLHNVILEACRNAGFKPKVAAMASMVETGIDLAARRFGITLVSSHFASAIRRQGLIVLPIEPAISRDILMTYDGRAADNTALNTLVHFLTAAYGVTRQSPDTCV